MSQEDQAQLRRLGVGEVHVEDAVLGSPDDRHRLIALLHEPGLVGSLPNLQAELVEQRRELVRHVGIASAEQLLVAL